MTCSTIAKYAAALAVLFMACPYQVIARETRNVELSGNLDERTNLAAPLPDNPSFQQLEQSSQYVTRFDVIDTLGVLHEVRVYFFHASRPGGPVSSWIALLYVDGSDVVGQEAGSPVELATIVLAFDANRNQSSISGQIRVNWSNGATIRPIALTMSRFTILDEPSSITRRLQDGCQGNCAANGALDFDGDSKDDVAIWRPSIGYWAIRRSSDNEIVWKQWGLPEDHPMPGDYTGDGLADLVVWRPADGYWYICTSEANYDCSNSFAVRQFGLPGDHPLTGDFDGDGILDPAVWRPGIGLHIFYSSRTDSVIVQQWGLPGDVPLGGRASD